MITILVYSLLIMLASLVGVVVVWRRAGALIERNLRYLVSFSAGVFLIVTYHLSGEVLGHAGSVTGGLAWILAGAVAIFLLFKLLPAFHHHHDKGEEGEHTHSMIDARRILVSDGLHNIGDGILLAGGFVVSPVLGVATAVGIFVHELVQEVSEFFVLRQAGYSTKQALGLNFLFSATILIGSLGSFFLLDKFEALEVPLLGLAAGSFLVVVFHDLIPHSVRTSQHKTHYLKHLLWFLIGLLIMLGINSIVADSH